MSPVITKTAAEPITGGSGERDTELGVKAVRPSSQGAQVILSASACRWNAASIAVQRVKNRKLREAILGGKFVLPVIKH